jgi:hypothetical protein
MTTWRIRSFTPRMAFILFTQGLLLEYCREKLSHAGNGPATLPNHQPNLVDEPPFIDDSMPATQQQLARYQQMYKALKPYSGNVIYCKAIERQPGVVDDHLVGWDALLTQAPTIHCIPGNHTSLLQYPYVKVLAETLQKEMKSAIDNHGNDR